MLEGRVEFILEDEQATIPKEVRKKFVAVMQAATWKFKSRQGKVLYQGLLIVGPKALPGTEFRCVAEVLTATPPGGIEQSILRELMEVVSQEYRKRTALKAD